MDAELQVVPEHLSVVAIKTVPADHDSWFGPKNFTGTRKRVNLPAAGGLVLFEEGMSFLHGYHETWLLQLGGPWLILSMRLPTVVTPEGEKQLQRHEE